MFKVFLVAIIVSVAYGYDKYDDLMEVCILSSTIYSKLPKTCGENNYAISLISSEYSVLSILGERKGYNCYDLLFYPDGWEKRSDRKLSFIKVKDEFGTSWRRLHCKMVEKKSNICQYMSNMFISGTRVKDITFISKDGKCFDYAYLAYGKL
jgi:hypothetical protein